MDVERERIEATAKAVIGAAIRVHRELGPGLLESVYQRCLAYELTEAGHRVIVEHQVPLRYRGAELDCKLRLDLVVDDCVIIEVKAVEALEEIHRAQAITYLKLTNKRLCLLINFNEVRVSDGIKRVVFNL